MYSTSQNYKDKIMLNATQHILKIYIDNAEINQDHIKNFKLTTELFNNNEFCLGCTPEAQLEIEIDKEDLKDDYKIIKVETGISDEIIPVGTYIIQKPIETDEFTAKIKAVDYMSKFEVNYDGSDLTYPQTMKEVLQDICKKVGVSLGTTTFLNEDKTIAVYDNTVTARTYLSYIAEQAGGFAVIGRDGKLYIKKFGEDVINIDINLFKDFKYGDKLSVSKISYEDGIQDYKFGDDTGDTIYINQNNVYIVDSDQVQNIYNQLKDFELYPFEGETIIDPAYDFGDILNINGKNVIYQGELIYEGKFVANIKSKIQAKTQQESMQTKTTTKSEIRKVKSTLNQIDGEISQIVEKQDGQDKELAKLQLKSNSIESEVSKKVSISDIQSGYYTKEAIDTLIQESENGLTNKFTKSGGDNIFRNTGLWFTTSDSDNPYEFWTGKATKTREDKAVNFNAITLKKGTFSQTQPVTSGNYCVSFKYKKLIELASVRVEINSKSYDLTEMQDTEFCIGAMKNASSTDSLIITDGSIIINFICDTDNCCEIYDLMVNKGSTALSYTQNQNETTTDTVNISKGITITSTDTDTIFKANADGIRTTNRMNQVLSKYTDKGMEIKDMKVTGQADIASLFIEKIDNQIWLNSLL